MESCSEEDEVFRCSGYTYRSTRILQVIAPF